MDLVKKFFPISMRATDVIGLVISIIIYALLPTALGLVNSCLGGIPVIGFLMGLILSVIGIYCLIGIVLAILVFCKKLV